MKLIKYFHNNLNLP